MNEDHHHHHQTTNISKRKFVISNQTNSNNIDDDDDNAAKTTKKIKQYRLVTFKELPDYMKDNEFIFGYYRANWPLKEAFFSIFRWHNETINIWTHFLGFILFAGLMVTNSIQMPPVTDLIISLITRSFPIGADSNKSHDSKHLFVGASSSNLLDLTELQQTASTNPVTRWPFFVFLGGSMFCLLCSSICHIFSCHSCHLNLVLWQIDYVGITVMIIASFFPPMFYVFQCDQKWQYIYLGGITILGIFTLVTLLSPSLSMGKYRSFRALLFSSMGLFGVIPAVHACVINWNNPLRAVTLAYEIATALLYLAGAGFYAARIPERWRPGWFDLAGHSHQIFHLLVVMGALAHYAATLSFLEWRDHAACNS